jgi:hypothetical protein
MSLTPITQDAQLKRMCCISHEEQPRKKRPSSSFRVKEFPRNRCQFIRWGLAHHDQSAGCCAYPAQTPSSRG